MTVKLTKKTILTAVLVAILGVFFAGCVYYNLYMRGYQQFSVLAESFLQGKLFFVRAYDGWWHDAVLFNGQHFWPLGPFPAVVLAPFVWAFGIKGIFFQQGYLQPFLVLGVLGLVFKIARRLKFNFNDSLVISLGVCFGSVFLAIAFWPNSWFFSQVVVTLLLLLVLYEYLGKKRYWLIGLIFGLVLLSRLTAFVGISFFGLEILFSKNTIFKKKIVNLLLLGMPILPFMFLLAGYNYLRFGDVFENGYGLQNVASIFDGTKNEGLFGLKHVVGNLYYLLFAAPQPVFAKAGSQVLTYPFIKADPWGMSIFLTSPYLLYLFFLKQKNRETALMWISVALISLPILFYYGIGWYQFGYRYSLDFFPFLVFIFLRNYRRENESLAPMLKILMIVSPFFNFYLFSHLFLL